MNTLSKEQRLVIALKDFLSNGTLNVSFDNGFNVTINGQTFTPSEQFDLNNTYRNHPGYRLLMEKVNESDVAKEARSKVNSLQSLVADLESTYTVDDDIDLDDDLGTGDDYDYLKDNCSYCGDDEDAYEGKDEDSEAFGDFFAALVASNPKLTFEVNHTVVNPDEVFDEDFEKVSPNDLQAEVIRQILLDTTGEERERLLAITKELFDEIKAKSDGQTLTKEGILEAVSQVLVRKMFQ